LIRVIGNDGINTGSATSQPFTVLGHPPVVHIDSPADQSIFPEGSQIILVGGGRDAEDGPLDNEALTWLVNGQPLGSGKEAAVGGLAPGAHVITLRAADNEDNVASAEVSITVAQDVPVASADSYRTPEDTPLTVESPGVLGNDIGPEGTTLTAELVEDVSNGSLTLNANGSFVFTPEASFTGVDRFSYQASGVAGGSNVVTVTLTTGMVFEGSLGIPSDDDDDDDDDESRR
jgi:Bacterial Ig domain